MTSETPTSPEALRAEIERTRADLGHTAAALAARTDVKARLRQSASRTSAQLSDRARQARVRLAGQADRTRARLAGRADRTRTTVADATRRPVPVAVTSAAATALVVAVVLARRARR